MLRKIISLVLVISMFMVTLVFGQASSEMNVLAKISAVELAVYGNEQTGSLVERLDKLEIDLYGNKTNDALMSKTDNLYAEINTNSTKPSLMTKINAVEWAINKNVTSLPIKQRIENNEKFIEGNIKTGDVYLQQGGRLIDGPNTTNGKWAHYNFLDKTGTIKNMEGTNGKDIYHSDIGHIYPDRIELTEGASTSRCPAVDHAKCVDVRSNKVIIYPNDKIIAYDVKVYIKGKHIYSRDRWINDLTKSDQNSFMPHLGYTKEHGLEVTYRYNYVFNEKNTATADLVWYKKIGWRPMFYDVQDEKNFYVKLQNGHTEDSNNNWIKKERDLTIGYKSHKFNKKWPLNYSAYASHGFWTGSGYDSWHSETGFFINHDTITFGKVRPLTLNLGTGYKLTHESANSSTTRSMLYSATLGKPFLGGWYSWLGYYWEKDRNNLFAYNMPDMARELQLGINKTFDSRNRLTFITRYDEGKSKIYEYIWRYTYDFCCWRLNFEFRDKKYENKRDWSVGYDLYRW